MIADRIKEVRKKTKLSQNDFGRALGVSRDVILNIELKRVEPKKPFIDHLCNIFNISEKWLLDGVGDMTDEHLETKKNINEAIKIFDQLSPTLQEHALKQIKDLLELQNNIKN